MASPKVQRRQTIAQLVRQEQDKLDTLSSEIDDGIRSAVHYDELEQRIRVIARGRIDAFRKGAVQ